MKKYNEIESVYGIIKLRRNSVWGYTARVEYINIDGDAFDYEGDRSMTASGCNYDKMEGAIHLALKKACIELPCYIPNYRHFGSKGFFGEHRFELKEGVIEIF